MKTGWVETNCNCVHCVWGKKLHAAIEAKDYKRAAELLEKQPC